MRSQPQPRGGGLASENMHVNRLNAGLQAVTANMIAPFISLLALRLGASNLQLGALGALPNLLTVLFTLPLIARLDGQRRHGPALGRAFLASRLCLLVLASVPLLSPPWNVWALVLVWGLHNFPFNAANSVIQGFLADILPADMVGEALAERGVVATVTGTVAVVVLGVLLDRLSFPAGYQGVAVAACLVGMAEVWAFTRFVEPERPLQPRRPAVSRWQSLRAGGRALWAQRSFVEFSLISTVFTFTWQMVWPIFSRYQVEMFGINNLWLAMITVAGSVGGVFTFRAWSRGAQRTNPARVLALAALGLALAPPAMLFSPSLYWVAFFQIAIGAAVAGATILLQQGSLHYAPLEQRPRFLAAHQTGMMVAASVAPLFGGWMIDVIGLSAALLMGFGLRLVSAALWWHLGRRRAPLSTT